MQRLVAFYNLKKGVTMEEYTEFSTLDQQVTTKQPGVLNFEVYEVRRSNQEHIPYQIAEVIDVESFAQWEKVRRSDPMAILSNGWRKCVDESSVLELYCEKIESTTSTA